MNGICVNPGDFHPQNILSAHREPWLAIDPKGVVGDPLYDVAVFVNNTPHASDESDWVRALARRIDLVADGLGVERRRIGRWSRAQSVLSGWWSYEDHGRGWEPAFQRARLLQSLDK